MKAFKIIFMGTPEFAVPSLLAIKESEHEIIGVVTQLDRPKGRGKKVKDGPVKSIAKNCNCSIYQPLSVNTDDFINKMNILKPDLFIVVAYGQLLSQDLLKVPVMGAINVHPSLLPKYRGPAPIQWAIINGDNETGVTTILMDKRMDAGKILLSHLTKVEAHDNAGSLHDRLAKQGANLLIKTLKGLSSGNITPRPQDDSLKTYAPLLKKNDGCIDWDKDAISIQNFIRGMTPWPGAYTFLNKKRIKIFKTSLVNKEINLEAGTVVKGFSNELLVATGKKGLLSILEIQSESGKKLDIIEFLKGNPISPDMKFEKK